jgi:hypothetical protein
VLLLFRVVIVGEVVMRANKGKEAISVPEESTVVQSTTGVFPSTEDNYLKYYEYNIPCY